MGAREDTAPAAVPHPVLPVIPEHGAAWRMLALVSVAELLGMSLWFAGSAAAPQLTARWDLSASQVGGLATAVQLGFVLGTAISALLNLADVVPARRLFALSAVLGAAANALLLTAPTYAWAIGGRVATGFFLAGVYPPAMKMAATWFVARRGLAVGTVVGALTIGKASPYLWHAVPGLALAVPIVSASLSAVLAAVLVLIWWRDGPHAFPARPFSWGLVGEVVRERRWRLSTAGYLGHMAELYSYWTWIPIFLAASAVASSGDPAAGAAPWVGVLAFATIAVGGLGCIWGGLVADRIGRARLAMLAMAISGACALLIGLTFGRSPWLVGALALVWGFFVIADSAQFSVLVTESVPPHAVGTALTVQVCIGFLLTTLTIQLVPPVVARMGWAGAFALLAIGPALGIMALRRLSATGVAPAAVGPSGAAR
jgi:MFS family permease